MAYLPSALQGARGEAGSCPFPSAGEQFTLRALNLRWKGAGPALPVAFPPPRGGREQSHYFSPQCNLAASEPFRAIKVREVPQGPALSSGSCGAGGLRRRLGEMHPFCRTAGACLCPVLPQPHPRTGTSGPANQAPSAARPRTGPPGKAGALE